MREGRGSRRGSGNRRGRGGRSRSAPRDRGGAEDKPRPLGAGVSEPEYAESLGSNLEEAIEKALLVLRAKKDDVDVKVLEEGKRGFLGIGMKRPYRVRVSWRKSAAAPTAEAPPPRERSKRPPSPSNSQRQGRRRQTKRDADEGGRRQQRRSGGRSSDRASRGERTSPVSDAPRSAVEPRPRRRTEAQVESTELNIADLSRQQLTELTREADDLTNELLRLMDMKADVVTRIDDDGLLIAIESEEDEALLIGRRGETRAALQQVINRVLSRRTGVFTPVLLDVAGYWQRRVERLTEDARELADKAVESGLKAQSEPLSPQERRVIHRALTDDHRVTTESIGKGLHKSVLIQPAESSDQS